MLLAEVKRRGDAALYEFTARFDRVDLRDAGLRIQASELEAAYSRLEPDLKEALTVARDRIESHHRRQRPAPG